MNTITKDIAREAILVLFSRWAGESGFKSGKPIPSGEAIMFYQFIEEEHSELLTFRSADPDKWQVVHGWLIRAGYSE